MFDLYEGKPEDNPEYTGELREAIISNYSDMSFGVVLGNIYGDTRDRFPDGTFVRTSLVQKIWETEEDGVYVVQTRNSLYKVHAYNKLLIRE